MKSFEFSFKKWTNTTHYALTARNAISNLQLNKEIGITQKSTWLMLRRSKETFMQKD